jgi:hypothetical protein
LTLLGCRGDLSRDPPIHLNPNMDDQAYLEAQEPSTHFDNGRGMRQPVPGTIAIGSLKDNEGFYRGKRQGQFVDRLQVALNRRLLDRARRRYEIYCAPCHGLTGEGTDAPMRKRGMIVPPPSYLDPRLRAMPVGQIFDLISNGVRNMPAYAPQIPTRDRWAIAAYVRALQIAGSATIERVPRAIAEQKGWAK